MHYIGIDLGGTNIKGALVDENGALLREHHLPTRVERGNDAVADGIAAVIRTLSEGETALGGVGVGCPGTIDDESGVIRYAANLRMRNYDLRAALETRCGCCAHLGNDANVAALGEALVGVGRGCESLIVVTLGTGVGGGVVLGGRLLTGYTGAASELGHMVIHSGGEPCTCGRRGCFEAYASATALIRETKRAMTAHPESLMHTLAAQRGTVDGRTAFDAAACGDEAARRVTETYIDNLACGLANLVNIFYPQTIALSGGVANQGEALLAPLREKVEKMTFGSVSAEKHTLLTLCTLGYRAGMVGAALLAKTAEQSAGKN